jgi:hypothetical protein
MAVNTQPAKLALLALLDGLTWPGSNQPEVRYGQPTEGEDAPFAGEMIFLGESRATTVPQFGARRDESFVLRVVVDVRHEGDDEQTTEARAWELLAAAEEALWDDGNISDTVNLIARIETAQVNVPEPQAWRTQIVADVTVELPVT